MNERSRAGALLRFYWSENMKNKNEQNKLVGAFFGFLYQQYLKIVLLITILILFFKLKIFYWTYVLWTNQGGPENKEIFVDSKMPLHTICLHKISRDSPIRVKAMHLFTKYSIKTFSKYYKQVHDAYATKAIRFQSSRTPSNDAA